MSSRHVPPSLLARLLAPLLAATLASVSAASPATREGADARFERALERGHWQDAARAGAEMVRSRDAAGRLDDAAAGALCDSLGRRLFAAGTPEAWAAAESLFRMGLARRERAWGPADVRVAANLATLATLLDYLGRWDDALPLAERAVAIRERTLGEHATETASSLRQLGLLRFQLGDFAGAHEPLARALTAFARQQAPDPARLADAHNNLGELARVRDRLDSAEVHFRQGLDVARARLPADDPVRHALANNLAGLYKDVGRFDEAEPLLEDLAATAPSAGDPDALATARLNLAEVRRLQDRPEEAEGLYALALAGAREALGARHPGLVLFLNQYAVCAQRLGDFARADSLYREAGDVVRTALGPEHLLVAQNLHDLARLRLQSGRAPEADSLLALALELRERSLGARHPDLALILVDQARARAGAKAAQEAVLAPLARAIALLDSTNAHPDARMDAYAQRATWQAGRGRVREAIADMRVALSILDLLRAWRGGGDETRAAFLADRVGLIDQMVGWQLEVGDAEGALATHERGRARVLLDEIAAGGTDLRAAIPPAVLGPLLEAERVAEARLAASHRATEDTRLDPQLTPRERLERLAALAARSDSAALDLSLARRRIQDASPLWHSVLGGGTGFPGVLALQRDVVPGRGVLLVYHAGRHGSHVFMVPANGSIEAWPLALDADDAEILGESPGPLDEPALERIVAGTSAGAGSPSSLGLAAALGGTVAGGFVSLPLRSRFGPDSLELRLHALWRALVPAPCRRRVLESRTVVVVPDGALQLLPFEALVTRPRGRSTTTHYWLDDGPAIVYGPSASSLRSLALRPKPHAAAHVAAALSVSRVTYAAQGDTAARGTRWSPLPGTGLETAAIRDAFGAASVDTLTGAGATERAVRAAMPGHRYLHLGTHGFAEVAGARRSSGLALAPAVQGSDGTDDGVLEAYEIHGLSLDCDLAVLSACESARGARVAGEGAYALSRAFLAAGARRVVASLWPVDDRASAAVIGGLFERLAPGARSESSAHAFDVARALRDARRSVRRDPRWSDPFYWAAFVLSGR